MKLNAIYRAAHVSIPAQAKHLALQGSGVTSGVDEAAAQLSLLGHGLARNLSTLGEEVAVRLRQITNTLNECSQALDQIADDFAARDAEAAAWLRQHSQWIQQHGYGGEPDRVRPPELPKER